MPFTDEQPFLDTISARDHEDGPRLQYADFLDEAGDPERAELVRVQVALARLPDDHPRRTELADRQAELLTANSARWTEHLGDLIVSADFRRGVLDSVVMYAGTFLSDGEELFRRARVRRLCLREAARVMPKLADFPLLAGVQELDLCGNELGNRGLALLARSPFLTQLEALDLGFNGLDDEGVAALARSSDFPRLAALALNDNGRITSEGLKLLAESPFFAGLTTLDVSGNDVGDAGVVAASAGTAFPRLHTLRLKGNNIPGEGIAALARAPLFARLLARSPRLELQDNAIGPYGAAALAKSPALDRATAIDLSRNELGDHGFAALVVSRHTARLQSLRLAGNQITDAGVSAVRDHLPPLLARLRALDLSGNRLTRYGLGMLDDAKGNAPVALDVTGNVQATVGGEAPVPVGEVVPGVLRGLAEAAEAAELRRRVSHPARRPGDHPNPGG